MSLDERDQDFDEGGAQYEELRDLARGITVEDRELPAPPPGLWDAIAAEAFGDGLEERGGPSVEVLDEPVDLNAERTRRRPQGTWVFAASAAVVAVVFLAVWGLISSDDPVVGTAELAVLADGDDGSGEARLVDADGSLRLEVDVDGVAPEGDEYLEVWLIESVDPLRLVSLGPVRGDGVYDLPPGLDPAAYRVVDISREPFDGDATHSGNSVLRGELQI